MPKLTQEPLIHEDCTIAHSHLGRYVEIAYGTRVTASEIGDYSYCDRLCDIANARISKFSNIASCVRIGATDHPLDRASLHHFMYRSHDYWPDAERDEAWFAHRQTRLAHIGHDTWIGHAAQIKPEVTIGHGAVVASGAIVTTDVAPYTIVGGVTAKPIRRRLPESVAERMVALAWWDWGHDRLRAALEDFRTLKAEAFLAKYEP
ncbi:chloramphenicol acetyltransferase [Thalassococcus sp. S3]|uniref:chloramphenicol acetyltransferase n=1 Tax=Thalassococcus sp. S3 TaxID=2017482 RepID=UPI00102487FC|nr:chloramphenicol acetyltransferase [Thalassococcus sp. S3]QBF30651.1 chloramphenicol acetyltransferase [Thalassococcus sp. S3]